jgi:TolA-binding protein
MKFQITSCCILVGLSMSYVGCLQTRSNVSSHEQSQVYSQKNIENQKAATAEMNPPKVDERDELIRTLNGRVESLENQIQTLQKDKDESLTKVSPESEKIALLQEALTKMEMQLHKLEGTDKITEKNTQKITPPNSKSSDAGLINTQKSKSSSEKSIEVESNDSKSKKQSVFEVSEEHFKKKEWKKAILSYQSHVEESPKAKTVPEAKYKIGVCFQELGLKDEAAAFYEEVIVQYPKTEAGKKSKIRLTSMKSKKAVK